MSQSQESEFKLRQSDSRILMLNCYPWQVPQTLDRQRRTPLCLVGRGCYMCGQACSTCAHPGGLQHRTVSNGQTAASRRVCLPLIMEDGCKKNRHILMASRRILAALIYLNVALIPLFDTERLTEPLPTAPFLEPRAD